MNESKLLEHPASSRLSGDDHGLGGEAAEIAGLLARAGVDHASALWFQLLELATQRASDWSDRSAASGAPLSPRAAALLGLRGVAAEILSTAPFPADKEHGAAEACLEACAGAEVHASRLPPRRRRWGEGAAPRPPQRSALLLGGVGCC